MSLMFRKKTYSQIYQGLCEVQSWLTSLNIKTANTRFEEIVENARVINERHSKDPSSVISGDISIDRFWYCLTDAYTFLDLYEGLRTLKSHEIPKGKLRDSLQGPLLPKDEVPGRENVNSRNIFFELELAARFMKSGIRVIGFDDIEFDFEGYRFCVQCKRLLSKDNIAHNIHEAYDQLSNHLSGSEKCRGMIGLSIEKLFNLDELVLDAKSPVEAEMRANKILDDFRRQHHHIWNQFLNIKFTGVILAFKCLVFAKSNNIHSFAYKLDFVPLPLHPRLQLADNWLIKGLGKRLGATFTLDP